MMKIFGTIGLAVIGVMIYSCLCAEGKPGLFVEQATKAIETRTDAIASARSYLPKPALDALWLMRLSSWDKSQESEWNSSIAKLRGDKAATEAIIKTMRTIPFEAAMSRFEMAYLLKECGTAEAIPALWTIVNEPIPAQYFKQPSFSKDISPLATPMDPSRPFIMLKMEAINAITETAIREKMDRSKLWVQLFKTLSSPYRSVRREAVASLITLFPNAGGLEKNILARLPKQDGIFFKIHSKPLPGLK